MYRYYIITIIIYFFSHTPRRLTEENPGPTWVLWLLWSVDVWRNVNELSTARLGNASLPKSFGKKLRRCRML